MKFNKERFYQEDVKDSGYYNNEFAFNEETDEYLKSKIIVDCPYCNRKFHPHLCKTEVHLDGGWEWVGYDYKQPYDKYGVSCPRCKKPLIYTEYIEQ